jgi:hypothetical protein
MSHQWDTDFEEALRRLAPAPRADFVLRLDAALREPPRRPRPAHRIALAAALSLALAAALGATGGLSYAASSFRGATKAVTRAATPRDTLSVRRLSAGGDQYRPGYGFGDANHNHDGPPGLVRDDVAPGALAPPLAARATGDGFGSLVRSSVTFDEQAHLYVSVIDADGTPLLLTQRSKRGGSRIGGPVSGPQTKFIQYAVLVPRAIPIALRIPANLLEPGQLYRLRIVAIDPQGNRSTLAIPFRAAL